MGDNDIGSLVEMDHGELTGMLTFLEVILALVKNSGAVGNSTVGGVKDDHPLTCTPDTEIDEVRRMMLERHAGRAAVDHAADRRAVALAEVGDAEQFAEGAAGHRWGRVTLKASRSHEPRDLR